MKWIENPQTDVEHFINDFIGDRSSDTARETLRKKFMDGYCLYFAHILQIAMGRGQVCWTAPFNHFVFKDNDNKCYDIEGRYNIKDHDTFYLIPEEYLGVFLNDFKHTKTETLPATKQDIIEIIKKFCNGNELEYNSEIEDYIS